MHAQAMKLPCASIQLYELDWHFRLKICGLTNVTSLPRFDASTMKGICVEAELWCGGSLLSAATVRTSTAGPAALMRWGHWLSPQNLGMGSLMLSQLPREVAGNGAASQKSAAAAGQAVHLEPVRPLWSRHGREAEEEEEQGVSGVGAHADGGRRRPPALGRSSARHVPRPTRTTGTGTSTSSCPSAPWARRWTATSSRATRIRASCTCSSTSTRSRWWRRATRRC